MKTIKTLSLLITQVMNRDAVKFQVQDVADALYETFTFTPSAQYYTIRAKTTLTHGVMKINAGSSIVATEMKRVIRAGDEKKAAKHLINKIVEGGDNNITLMECISKVLVTLCRNAKPEQYILGNRPILMDVISTHSDEVNARNLERNISSAMKYSIINTPNEVTFSMRFGEFMFEYSISNAKYVLHNLSSSSAPSNVNKFIDLAYDAKHDELISFFISVIKNVLRIETDIDEDVVSEHIPDLHPDTYELSDELKSYIPEGCITNQKTIITVQHYNTEDGPTHTIDVGPILIKVDSSFENVLEFVITPELQVRTVVMDIHLSTRSKSRFNPSKGHRHHRDANSIHFRPSRT